MNYEKFFYALFTESYHAQVSSGSSHEEALKGASDKTWTMVSGLLFPYMVPLLMPLFAMVSTIFDIIYITHIPIVLWLLTIVKMHAKMRRFLAKKHQKILQKATENKSQATNRYLLILLFSYIFGLVGAGILLYNLPQVQ